MQDTLFIVDYVREQFVVMTVLTASSSQDDDDYYEDNDQQQNNDDNDDNNDYQIVVVAAATAHRRVYIAITMPQQLQAQANAGNYVFIKIWFKDRKK